MSSGHAHTDSHGLTGQRLRTAVVLTALILVVETVSGLLSHSLALLSDAGHILTDVVALALALFAAGQSQRPADATNTYGYHRTGILVALINAATLIAIVLAIAIEAIQRFQHPETVAVGYMLVAPAVAIAVNLFIGFGLAHEKEDLNVRAAVLHVFGDVAASAAVIVAAALILLTGWAVIDPILSLAIALLIAIGAFRVLREAVAILMEATPHGVDVTRLARDLVQVPRVRDVHDLHVWSISSGMRMLSAHVQVEEDLRLSDCDELVLELRHLLRDRYGIGHSTLQFECAGCSPHPLYCALHSPPERDHHHEAVTRTSF
ncbi:MAG: cation diffusion facilitator family transporter [Chloroflexi bacterium]|nr:cation diffusion facilitator family transporter [Chloroflexota bacterium]